MMDDTKGKLNLDVLSEECIWMSDGLPRALETNRLPAAALQLRQMATNYRALLDALYKMGIDPFAITPTPARSER